MVSIKSIDDGIKKNGWVLSKYDESKDSVTFEKIVGNRTITLQRKDKPKDRVRKMAKEVV